MNINGCWSDDHVDITEHLLLYFISVSTSVNLLWQLRVWGVGRTKFFPRDCSLKACQQSTKKKDFFFFISSDLVKVLHDPLETL